MNSYDFTTGMRNGMWLAVKWAREHAEKEPKEEKRRCLLELVQKLEEDVYQLFPKPTKSSSPIRPDVIEVPFEEWLKSRGVSMERLKI